MRILIAALIVMTLSGTLMAGALGDVYRLGPDSMQQKGVPQGRVIGPTTLPSNVYPNTKSNYWVYGPGQYEPSKPACLMIFQDGHFFVNAKEADGQGKGGGEYRIPNVFDNLIYRREMPVTIAVFINPGRTAEQKEATDSEWGDKTNNRRIEYNALDDKYARLIVEELMPELRKQYKISDKPEDHAIAGASSGAICAFTVAWQRPDQFRKVISTIGSFTNIMGGHVYPDLVRESEPKPIRVFLQDGVNDNRGRRGRRGGDDPHLDRDAHHREKVEALTGKKYHLNFTIASWEAFHQ